MNREEFIKSVEYQVKKYIYLADEYGENAQIRVNPPLLLVDLLDNKGYQRAIDFSDEAIENAAYAEGDETMSAGDYQATQDPEFFPVSTLIRHIGANQLEPDFDAINKVADRYFK